MAQPVKSNSTQNGVDSIELGDIILALDMDGPTYIPWTHPAVPWDHIPEVLRTLITDGVCGKRVSVCVASFNPSIHGSNQRTSLDRFFFAGRYGAHHDWVSEGGVYPEAMRSVTLLKSEQLRNMLGDKVLEEKLVIFIDDTLKNCLEVQRTLGIPVIYLPNEITESVPHPPDRPHRGFTYEMIKELVEMMGDKKKTNFVFHQPH